MTKNSKLNNYKCDLPLKAFPKFQNECRFSEAPLYGLMFLFTKDISVEQSSKAARQVLFITHAYEMEKKIFTAF